MWNIVEMTSTPKAEISNDLPYASKLVVSLVRSPLYNNEAQMDRELKQFFSTKRQLKTGHFFKLASLKENGSCYEYLRDKGSRNLYFSLIWLGLEYQFKIVDTEPKLDAEFYADNLRTTLVQTELGIEDKWIWPVE